MNYADVHIPAWTDSKHILTFYVAGDMSVDIPETVITNIQYNKITKNITYKVQPTRYHVVKHTNANVSESYHTILPGLYVFSQMSIQDDAPNQYGLVDWDQTRWTYQRLVNDVVSGTAWRSYSVDSFVDVSNSDGAVSENQAYDNYDKAYKDAMEFWGPSYVPSPMPNPPTKMRWRTSITDTYDDNLNTAQNFTVSRDFTIDLVVNSAPTLSISTPSDQMLLNDPGMNSLNIEGVVQDPDNNDLTVTAEIPNVWYKSIKVPQAGGTKPFSIPLDIIQDSIPPGDYTVWVKAVDPSNAAASASVTVKVRQRLKRNIFVLVDSPIQNATTYTDTEGDIKYAERYRYDHDAAFFDSGEGLISGSGLWRTTPYTSFPLPGLYIATYQPRDTPKSDDRFDEFRMWSRDNLTQMRFQVHRKPIALFSAKQVNGTLQVADSSYDLDHTSRADKGLIDWQWQYKKGEDELWTEGLPSGTLSTTDLYTIRLRVRDIDGDNNLGVWSDWCVRTVGASAGNLAPVAMFTVNPNPVSYRKATVTTDKSFDPDNDPLDIYQWTVSKEGGPQVWSYSGGPAVPPNIAAYGIGNFQVSLQVRDNRGLWSLPYSQTVTVMNHPPNPAFNMPGEVYRDTVIAFENNTPDPDEDGDSLTYAWNTRVDNSGYYYAGNSRNPTISVQNMINWYSLDPKKTISDGWEVRLTASDGQLSGNATKTFEVKNHKPTAAIVGSDTATQYNTYTYASNDQDEDIADQPILKYYWRITDTDGQISMKNSPNVSLTYDQPGVYTLEHWAVDQIGDKSNIASLKVTVAENQPPAMTLTSPAGLRSNPTITDAEKEGDPLIKWNYSDPDGDPQEKYRLEFYTKDSLLAKTIENDDSTGSIRQYQMPNQSLERFLFYSVVGRAYSKNNWSEISNEKAFIIDNPPVPGFTLITDTGKDATKVPIYRTDVLQIESTAYDDDEAKGDTLSYQYFLKKSGSSEGLVSAAADFSKQFTSNGTFTYRQVVTDSLGLFREITHALTVVNRLPAVNLTFPTSDTVSKPTISSTLTPIIKWSYSDPDGDEQQRFQVKIYDAVSSALLVDSGEQISTATQWKVPAGALEENRKYAVEVTVHDGLESEGFGSATSPRKYMLVNLLSVKGGVKHTSDWNINRQNNNLKQTGNPEIPRPYTVFWAGEKFVLVADATGLPDTIEVTIPGGLTTQLSPVDEDKKLWNGSLYDESFQYLPDGPITFTFTATNEYQTKTDKVTVNILGNWDDYYRSHRIK
ncbi:hypothetical protein [Paenibacillus sinensis]|uniref:hypothetical protein n=1 Tax=Paenibacillus sinensis TaxID=2834413 RepID=UPI001CA7D3DA|nr:hypothetical protein [Paenibacillus sinensis]